MKKWSLWAALFVLTCLFLAACGQEATTTLPENHDALLEEALGSVIFPECTTENLELKLDAAFEEVQLVIHSENQSAITDDGIVTCQSKETKVRVTVTVKIGSEEKSKTVKITVPAKEMNDREKLEAAKAELAFADIQWSENIYLPSAIDGFEGVSVTWKSSDTSVITDAGAITRPAYGQEPKTVVLNATLTCGDESTQAAFFVTVKPYDPEVILKDMIPGTDAVIVEKDGKVYLQISGSAYILNDGTVERTIELCVVEGLAFDESKALENLATDADTRVFRFECDLTRFMEGDEARIYLRVTEGEQVLTARLDKNLLEQKPDDDTLMSFGVYDNCVYKLVYDGIVHVEVDDYFLVGGKVHSLNLPFVLREENGKVYLSFKGVYAAPENAEQTLELIITTQSLSAETLTGLDMNQIIYTASNLYAGSSNRDFEFDINVTDDVGTNSQWMRFVLKVTEGDQVTYYYIKPYVVSNDGDWIACGDVIEVDEKKYELAICWSVFLLQVKSTAE